MNQRAQSERKKHRVGGGIQQQDPKGRGHKANTQVGDKDGTVRKIPRDCATSNYNRVIHDALTWRFLQDTYIETVNHRDYFKRREKLPSYNGFSVEVVVKDNGHRGRSVYAAEPIRKGTKVWDSTHLVRFLTPNDLQSFLAELDHDLQCDVLLWAYIEKGEGHVALALDPGSYVNHGETEDVINLDGDCYALRDIEVGEELLEDYSKFIGFGKEEGMEWYNQIRGWAWQEGELGSHEAQSTDEYNMLGAPRVWGGVVINQECDLSAIWILAVGILFVGAFILSKLFHCRSSQKEKEGL
eukprot:jgi/Psemu1/11337/gm1.11337_g